MVSKNSGITALGMLASASAKDQWLTESFGRGDGALLGRIAPSGARSFYYRYKGTAGQVRLPIGAFASKGDGIGTFTVAQARARAQQLAAMRREHGVADLREHLGQVNADRQREAELERQRREQEAQALQRRLTVRRLFDHWARVALAPHVRADGRRSGRKDGGEYIRQQFERRIFPALGDIAATDIRKSDVMAVLDEVKAAGKLRTANVLLTSLKQMFRFALVREVVDRNPLDLITKGDAGGKDAERERVLSAEEVSALAAAIPLANLGARSAAAIWLMFSSACRVGEAMGARWQDVDTVQRRWHLPQTKNERPHTIHLSAFALRQIQVLEAAREASLIERLKADEHARLSPWLFPNKANDGPVCVKSFGKQLADRQREPEQRMQHRAKSTKALTLVGGRWTAHDLRRTAASMMAELGFSGDVIDECLNHVIESRTRRTYIRDRRQADQARAFDALGARLTELTTNDAPASNVLALQPRAA